MRGSLPSRVRSAPQGVPSSASELASLVAPPLRGGRFARRVGPVRVASLTGRRNWLPPRRGEGRQPVRDAGGFGPRPARGGGGQIRPNSERVPRQGRGTRPPSDFCRSPSRGSCPPHGPPTGGESGPTKIRALITLKRNKVAYP